MFSRIRKIMNSGLKGGNGNRSNEQEMHIAACVLLLEAAHIDGECHDDEMAHIVDTIKTKFNLSHEYAEELIELSHAERRNSVDLWQFTNQINQNFSKEEKITVMEDVWRIIHVDGQLEKHEDYFAHKVANLLRLTHTQLIDAKLQARKQLKTD